MERQVGHSCRNANLRNLELFKGTWEPPKVSENADHKWQGSTLRCVLGEINRAVEERTLSWGETDGSMESSEKVTAAIPPGES